MKKITFAIAVVLLMVALFSVLNVLGEMPLRIVVNGDRLYFPDAQPFIDSNGRTQTPARFIGEELGATVTWDGAAQKATFVKGNKKLILYIGKKEYELGGKMLQMDTVALLQDGRTFVPARYVAEALDATVRWDSAVRTVYVDTIEVVSTPEPKITPGPTLKPAAGLSEVDKKAIADRFREWHDFDLKGDKKNIFNYLSSEYKARENIKTYEDIVFPLYEEGALFHYNNPNYMYISSAVEFAKERTGYSNDSDFKVLCLITDYDKTHYKVFYGLFDNNKYPSKLEAYAYGCELVVKENGNWYFDNISESPKTSERFLRREAY
jgi:hypothetical protein